MKNFALFAFFLAVASATSWQCFFCQEVVQIVENYIQGGGIKNETEVLDALEGLCQYLGNYQQEVTRSYQMTSSVLRL